MSFSPPKGLHSVTHCIFDNDGTLMDTEDQYQEAVQNLLRPFGHIYTYEIKMRCMGLPSYASSELLVNEFKLPMDVAEFEHQFHEEVQRLMTNVGLMPGVRKLLIHLYENRIPMAVATSAPQQCFQRKSARHAQLFNVFRHIVCGDDPEIGEGKPAPDIFLLAAARFQPRAIPACCLVFEDSPAGVAGAVAAGMQAVMIPDSRVPDEKRKDATLVLSSMAEFQPELFGLPPYDNCSEFTFG